MYIIQVMLTNKPPFDGIFSVIFVPKTTGIRQLLVKMIVGGWVVYFYLRNSVLPVQNQSLTLLTAIHHVADFLNFIFTL